MRPILILCCCFLLSAVNAQTTLDSKFPITSNYFTSFDGTKIYYEVRGEGKPVLLVHGFVVNSNSWKGAALYKNLLEEGFKVILLDMRGNGKSDKPHDAASYANDAEAKDIIGLLHFLKIKNYSVVGYSRGSIITSRLLLFDKRISTAVMGGMDTAFTNPQWPRRLMFYHALIGDSVAPELNDFMKYVQRQELDQLALAYLQKEQPSSSKKELQSVIQPVLVIKGKDDPYVPSAEQLSKYFRKGSFAITPGDHDHAASTVEFSAAVIAFLKKH